jgi:hypothetical protein
MATVETHNIIDESTLPSLDLLYELTKERNQAQREQKDKLDNKAFIVLTSSTAIVSAALVLASVLPTSPDASVHGFLQSFFMHVLLVLYCITMCLGLAELVIRNYKLTPDPGRLYDEYLIKPSGHTKAKVYRSMVDDYEVNQEKIAALVFLVKCAIVALWFEILVFVIFLVVHNFR